MTYEFSGLLYDTVTEMNATIADSWVSACGMNSRADILDAFADCTDVELAAECATGWSLRDTPAFDMDELAYAFHVLRIYYTAR